MMDFFIITKATLISFLTVERKLKHIYIIALLWLLVLSLLCNVAFLIPEPEEPEPYKMTEVDYRSKIVYVTALSDLYAFYVYTESPAITTKMPVFLDEMDVYTVACNMIDPKRETGEIKRLTALVTLINKDGCTTGEAQQVQ